MCKDLYQYCNMQQKNNDNFSAMFKIVQHKVLAAILSFLGHLWRAQFSRCIQVTKQVGAFQTLALNSTKHQHNNRVVTQNTFFFSKILLEGYFMLWSLDLFCTIWTSDRVKPSASSYFKTQSFKWSMLRLTGSCASKSLVKELACIHDTTNTTAPHLGSRSSNTSLRLRGHG